MGTEIERKFLVDVEKLEASGLAPDHIYSISQAFIVNQPDISVRVRIMTNVFDTTDSKVKIGFKLGKGPIRTEFEYDIDRVTADALLVMYPVVHKTRSIFPDPSNEDRVWEVDEFDGKLKGLYIAEIEVENLDDDLDVPSWAGPEVTWNAEYYNCNLAYNEFVPYEPAPVTVDEVVERKWNEFWKDIVTDEDGTLNLDKVKCELHDFGILINNIPEIYMHITGGKASKHMIDADVIKALHDDYVTELFEDYKKDMLEITEGCDADEMREIWRNY